MKISDVIVEARVNVSNHPKTLSGKFSGALDAIGQAVKYAPYPGAGTSFAVDVTSEPDEPEIEKPVTDTHVKKTAPKLSGNVITVPATRNTPERTYYRSGNSFVDEKGNAVSPELHQALKALSKGK